MIIHIYNLSFKNVGNNEFFLQSNNYFQIINSYFQKVIRVYTSKEVVYF